MSVASRDHLFELLSGFCERSLTDEETQELERLICEDRNARDAYLDYMEVHAELHRSDGFPDVYGEDEEGPIVCELPQPKTIPSLRDPAELADRSSQRDAARPAAVRLWHDSVREIVRHPIAAVLVVGVLVGSMAALIYGTGGAVDATAAEVAVVSGRSLEAQWQGAAPSELVAGERYELTAGVTEFFLPNETQVICQGPASFEVIDGGTIALDRGKLVAYVPPAAVGFTVRIPGADVVDLGTEFGVQVQDDGKSLVHVFTGEVSVQSPQTQGEKPSLNVRLGKDESVMIYEQVASPVAVEAGNFVRAADIERMEKQKEPIVLPEF